MEKKKLTHQQIRELAKSVTALIGYQAGEAEDWPIELEDNDGEQDEDHEAGE